MKILLVHPQALPKRRAAENWDRIVDLSWAPGATYARWEKEFCCPVEPLDKYADLERDLSLIRDFSARGAELTDHQKINWWELFILWHAEPIQLIACLQNFAAGLNPSDDVFVTNACFESEALHRLRRVPVQVLSNKRAMPALLHYFRELWSLPNRDLLQVFWDKYDARFTVRGRFKPNRANVERPVVLIPSAYVNASRTGLKFAACMPDQESLVITTRASGKILERSGNVHTASLAGYVSGQNDPVEEKRILDCWKDLEGSLANDPNTAFASELGILRAFPQFLKRGLAIRNAWMKVLESEPVQGVISCDNNPDTMLPIFLAKRLGIPTISMHHGALDWRHRFVPAYADAIIAKGKMEEDHLSRVCGIAKEKIAVGVPEKMIPDRAMENGARNADSIVFFSEAYEANRVRGEEMYREMVPRLADLAIRNQRRLIVKLHPFESLRKRKALLKKILSPKQMQVTSVVTGALTADLLSRTWFGVTVLSTVAMELQAAGIACFLCAWLEYPHHGYGDQFRRFGVGYSLQSSNEIHTIPSMLEHLPKPSIADLWQAMDSHDLQQLFCRSEKAVLASST